MFTLTKFSSRRPRLSVIHCHLHYKHVFVLYLEQTLMYETTFFLLSSTFWTICVIKTQNTAKSGCNNKFHSKLLHFLVYYQNITTKFAVFFRLNTSKHVAIKFFCSGHFPLHNRFEICAAESCAVVQ